MKRIHGNFTSMALATLIAACGGSDSPSVIDGGLPPGQSANALCQNAYYRNIIGRYEGTAVFKVRADDGSETPACTWTISMDVRHEGSPVVCDLIAEIEAPVEQSIVLNATDPDAFQCFPDDSLRSVIDPHIALDPSEFSNIPFPVELDVNQNFSISSTGPYFGDDSVNAIHHRLLDLGWIDEFQISADGTILLKPSSNSDYPFEGMLNRLE